MVDNGSFLQNIVEPKFYPRVLVNFCLWVSVAFVCHFYESKNTANAVGLNKFKEFINVESSVILFVSAVFVFALFAFIKEKSKNTKAKSKSQILINEILEELTSVTISIGSILFVVNFLRDIFCGHVYWG